jgi:hypothetical protein
MIILPTKRAGNEILEISNARSLAALPPELLDFLIISFIPASAYLEAAGATPEYYWVLCGSSTISHYHSRRYCITCGLGGNEKLVP